MAQDRPQAYTFGPFRVDVEQGALYHAGALVPLTPKAFQTLAALVENAGRVMSKADLIRTIWPDTFVEESNLTQNVFTLRRLLGDAPGGRAYIETVPRRGYRFAAPVQAVRAEAGAAPVYRQLTFKRGTVASARFARGGEFVVYSAAWSGAPAELFGSQVTNPAPIPLRVSGAELLAVSRRDELALALGRRHERGYTYVGRLARRPFAGGAPVETGPDVHEADFAPDGGRVALVRERAGRSALEYPEGTVLVETGGWLSSPRVSPDGRRVAYVHHPVPDDDSGSVEVVEASGAVAVLTSGWISVQGLSWAPGGDEVWFAATKAGNARALHAVTLAGAERLVEHAAGSLILHDISPRGQVLVARDDAHVGIMAGPDGEELDLSWQDWSLARDLSRDGRWLLFTEAGEGGGATYAAYLRSVTGSAPVRLGAGSALALSPDGRWALAKVHAPRPGLVLLPTEGGAPVPLPGPDAELVCQPWACWTPDGGAVVFAAGEPGRGSRLYRQALDGPPRPITDDEGVVLTSSQAVSPDGLWVAALGPDRFARLYPLAGGPSRAVPGLGRDEAPLQWSADGGALYVTRRGEVPARVSLVGLATGDRRLVRELMPSDPAGVREILRVLLTPDGGLCAYTFTRHLSVLYEVTGLR